LKETVATDDSIINSQDEQLAIITHNEVIDVLLDSVQRMLMHLLVGVHVFDGSRISLFHVLWALEHVTCVFSPFAEQSPLVGLMRIEKHFLRHDRLLEHELLLSTALDKPYLVDDQLHFVSVVLKGTE
jgi:hypothetical protein